MVPFLYQVAKVYIENESDNLCDYVFVFPNKRSGVFFAEYMSKLVQSSQIMPKVSTISEFIYDYTNWVDASRLELIFILYNEYKNILVKRNAESHIVDYDKFQFWAEMILNDFNDTDKYLVDAKQLFSNVKKLKEISSNFLTEEQIEVIKQFWGESHTPEVVSSFWKHIHNGEDNVLSSQFVKMWEILYDLYTSFRRNLIDKGLCYQGMAYREVAENIKERIQDKLLAKRYIFVGFNVMSTSEIKIFEQLKAADRADYYWDLNSPAYEFKENKAIKFVGKYVEQFKSKYNLDEKQFKEFPLINVLGIPSNIGQVKEVSKILSRLNKNKEISDVNTAIVFPDESLFIPMLHSLPAEIKSINVTMGYPLRHTPVASLISNIASLQMRARRVKGKYQFFYEDILSVLSHSLVQTGSIHDCKKLIRFIKENRTFNLTADFICEDYKSLSLIFTPVKDLNNPNEVINYLKNIVNWLGQHLAKDQALDRLFLDKYVDELDELLRLIQLYNITMSEKTVFHIVEKALCFESINFTGEPLCGLQMMGVLETRALDFENLIILSMNEKVFPRKHYAKTFIPDSLRKGYGMSTIAFQESMYAYYFYRMISRAKNVYILYDARMGGLRSGEMSRYLYQLKFLYQRDKINFSMVNYKVHSPQSQILQIEKNEEILNKLSKYKDPESKKYISASALKQYISCPLAFYLKYIEDISVDEEVPEYMDDITFGSIIHAVAEKLYMNFKGDKDKVLITRNTLDDFIKNEEEINRQITYAVNMHYNKLGKNNSTPLIGDSKVLGDIMLRFIKLMFEKEKEFDDFYFIDAEKKVLGQWEINDKHTINFKMIIDRIDEVKIGEKYVLRFVDYKTGTDKIEEDSIDLLFDKESSENHKAIFQLLLYCFSYAHMNNYDKDIQPYLYLFKTLNKSNFQPIKINRIEVNSHKDYKEEFWPLFENLIDEIFDENIPFTPSKNEDSCKFCELLDICNKELKN